MSEHKPVIAAICGVKNSGKTTLIAALITRFNELGKKVAVIKHDGHDFHCDIPGTDTYRFSAAGAYGVAAFSKNRTFLHRTGNGDTISDLTALLPDADVILVEGMKDSSLRKIELVRNGISREAVSNPEGRFLIVTDLPAGSFSERCVSFDEIGTIAGLILQTETCRNMMEKAADNSARSDDRLYE